MTSFCLAASKFVMSFMNAALKTSSSACCQCWWGMKQFSLFRLVTKAHTAFFQTNISKFQFSLEVRHFSHEPLARVIAQALPVFDIKFTFTFTNLN